MGPRKAWEIRAFWMPRLRWRLRLSEISLIIPCSAGNIGRRQVSSGLRGAPKFNIFQCLTNGFGTVWHKEYSVRRAKTTTNGVGSSKISPLRPIPTIIYMTLSVTDNTQTPPVANAACQSRLSSFAT